MNRVYQLPRFTRSASSYIPGCSTIPGSCEVLFLWLVMSIFDYRVATDFFVRDHKLLGAIEFLEIID